VIDVPAGVTVTVNAGTVTVKGAKGELKLPLSAGVTVSQENKQIAVQFSGDEAVRIRAGSTRAHIANMVNGVTRGYERKLELVGVGYRAQVQGKALNLTLGFSHPVNFAVPEGITIETPPG
jgi:large subunit ribosomal protein L6